MKKVISILLIIFVFCTFFITNESYAKDKEGDSGGAGASSGVDAVIEAMKDTSNAQDVISNNSNTQKTINNVIGILQFVGSGISIIVITLMGIKYILASPAEKAEVKKMIVPIIIGCVLLFGAVNLVGAIEEFSAVLGE